MALRAGRLFCDQREGPFSMHACATALSLDRFCMNDMQATPGRGPSFEAACCWHRGFGRALNDFGGTRHSRKVRFARMRGLGWKGKVFWPQRAPRTQR